eukprot:1297511-Prymnesium_polylepis.2
MSTSPASASKKATQMAESAWASAGSSGSHAWKATRLSASSREKSSSTLHAILAECTVRRSQGQQSAAEAAPTATNETPLAEKMAARMHMQKAPHTPGLRADCKPIGR